jgi:hypothetical protein
MAVPSAIGSSAGPHLSDTEITALLARGQRFLSAGDITSARGFYKRAAGAESRVALAAGGDLRSGFLGPRRRSYSGLDSIPTRPGDLGVGEAEQRIKAFERTLILPQDVRGSRTGAEEEREPVLGDLRLNLGTVPIEPIIAYTVDQPPGKAVSVELGIVPTANGKASSAHSPEDRALLAASQPNPARGPRPFSFRKRAASKFASSSTLPAHPSTRAIEDLLRTHPDLLK